jgi:adenine-specific DNA-methyltransferase
LASELDALLARVDDEALRRDLTTQFDRLRQKRQFGLVFEEHLPERVALPQHPIRRGAKVVPRDDPDAEPRAVIEIDGSQALVSMDEGETESVALTDLVSVAEFGEPIYPGLKRLGSVDRGGEKPSHVVIKGENHHALEALQFTHAGKVDCIYIDPPYNTGARDWKYNNDYVDGDDAYRHSKWLAMMQRRLLVAKDLLNPDDSVLIVTIDEKEYLRLGMLLDQTFPSAIRQMTTVVINPLGQARKQELARVEEYVFFVLIGAAQPCTVADDLLMPETDTSKKKKVRWEWLLRGGTNSRRDDRPNLFYPVFVDPERRCIIDVGDSLALDTPREGVASRNGLVTVWPLRTNGDEGNWRTSPAYLRKLLTAGHAKLGAHDVKRDRWSILYLGKAQIERISEGQLQVTGRDEQGAVVVESSGAELVTAKTVWNRSSHRAGEHGSNLLKRFLPGRPFPFPKSLYAVEDAIRLAVGDRRDAVVLDFFAGSGTTGHACMRLNRMDGGQRRSIIVTNNEVSEDEAKRLSSDGFLPGDPEWEALGIFERITRPRIETAVTGLTPEGEPVKGDYKFADEFPMAEGLEENVEFLELTYLDAEDIELDLAFTSIAPLLWMRAGSKGPLIEDRVDADGELLAFASTDSYAVLFEPDEWRGFVAELPKTVSLVFIVTDSASVFATVSAELPAGVETVRLYENYLSTFTINQGGGGR